LPRVPRLADPLDVSKARRQISFLGREERKKMKRCAIGKMLWFAAISLLVADSPVCLAKTAPPARPVDVRLTGVTLIKSKAISPIAGAATLPTAGTDLAVIIRSTDGRSIRSIEDVRIVRATDDTGAAIPVTDTVVRSIARTAGGETVVETVRRWVKVEGKSSAERKSKAAARSASATQPQQLTVGALEQTGGTTASATIHLGLPSGNAKALARVEGSMTAEIGKKRVLTFKNIASQVHKSLQLGPQSDIALEVAEYQNGKVRLVTSGKTDRLGEFEFHDQRGKRLWPFSTTLSTSVKNGVGQQVMEFDLGNVTGAVNLIVAVFDSVEQVEIPFAFENVPLP